MSASFYISPASPDSDNQDSDLRVDLDEFVAGLKSLWPEIDIWQDSENLSWLYWNVNYHNCDAAEDCMSGSIEPKRRYVYVDAHSKRQTVGKFAVWYRTLVPAAYQLFVGASWGGHFELTINMQLSEILKAVDLLENHPNV